MLDVEKKVREILVQAKAIQAYKTTVFQALLTCYQVKGLGRMKKDTMSAKWKELLESISTHQFAANREQGMK